MSEGDEKQYKISELLDILKSASKKPPTPIEHIVTIINEGVKPHFSDGLRFEISLMPSSDTESYFSSRNEGEDGYYLIMKYKALNEEGELLRFSSKLAAICGTSDYPFKLIPIIKSANFTEEEKTLTSNTDFIAFIKQLFSSEAILRRVRRIKSIE